MTKNHTRALGLLAIGIVSAATLGRLAPRSSAVTPAVDAAGVSCSAASGCQARVGEGGAAAPLVQGRPRLLAFSSQDCPACKRMASVVEAAEQTCDAADDVMHVSLDDDAGQAIASRYKVELLPSYVSVDADGHEVARLGGVQTRERIEQSIEEVRGVRCASADAPRRARTL